MPTTWLIQVSCRFWCTVSMLNRISLFQNLIFHHTVRPSFAKSYANFWYVFHIRFLQVIYSTQTIWSSSKVIHRLLKHRREHSHRRTTVCEEDISDVILPQLGLGFELRYLEYSGIWSEPDTQCSAQVFKRAGCHLKRADLVRWTDHQRAHLARWTEEKGTISAVNGRKRALLTRWTDNGRGTAQSRLCVENKKDNTELVCLTFKKNIKFFWVKGQGVISAF